MGRPREHGTAIAGALLDVAERIAEADGVDALSLRRIADEAGTTTRAVYSLYGSKEGLIAALGMRAFRMLGAGIDARPETSDPRADLAEAGVSVFRRFALGHPALFEIAFQRRDEHRRAADTFRPSASTALASLESRITRLEPSGDLGGRTVPEAALQFHSLCEGLAAVELRTGLPDAVGERMWRQALSAFVAGLHEPVGAGIET